MCSCLVSTKRRTSCLAHHHANTNGIWATRGSGLLDHETKKVDFASLPAKGQSDDADLKEIGILYGGSLIASTIIGRHAFYNRLIIGVCVCMCVCVCVCVSVVCLGVFLFLFSHVLI